MVKITWLGDEPKAEPPSIVWNGIKFIKGQPVEISDPHMIRKAKGNQYFSVEETNHDKKEKEEKQIEEQDLADPKVKEAYRRQTPTGYSPKKPAKKKPEQTAAATGADADA